MINAMGWHLLPCQRVFPGKSPELFSGGPGPEPPEIKAQAEKLA
jgi:hypothetical protein